MHVVVAPNAFKGSFSAAAVAGAMAHGVRRIRPDATIVELPMADGGDGTMEVLLKASAHSHIDQITTSGAGLPGISSKGSIGWTDETTALLEMASVAGIASLAGRLSPLTASSAGLGEAIRIALDNGATRLIIALGGSASTDGGTGALTALGFAFLDPHGNPLPAGGAALIQLAQILPPRSAVLPARLEGAEITLLADVSIPLLGANGAASRFGPQKGASPKECTDLDRALSHFARITMEYLEAYQGPAPPPIPVRAAGQAHTQEVAQLPEQPGAGAAGGTAFGLAAFLGAKIVPGAAFCADAIGLSTALLRADYCLTGEGELDPTTAAGKAPFEVGLRARRHRVPCGAVAGKVSLPPGSTAPASRMETDAPGHPAPPPSAASCTRADLPFAVVRAAASGEKPASLKDIASTTSQVLLELSGQR